jgi:energy-coupling factor transport system permease protein
MPLSPYVPSASPLHRLHPVTKLLGFLALVAAAFLVERPVCLLPLAVGVVGLLAVGRALVRLRQLRLMFVLVTTFTVVIWTFFYQRGAPLRPSWAGLQFGIATAIRLDLFLAMSLLLLAVTRVEELAYAFARLGVPYVAGFTLTLAFRLVPVFFDASLTILQAQRCRGLEFGRGGPLVRLRRFVPVLVPVFIGALRRADHMAMALELRGFNSGRPRTTFLRARAGWGDAVAATLALATLGAYVTVWARGAGALVLP